MLHQALDVLDALRVDSGLSMLGRAVQESPSDFVIFDAYLTAMREHGYFRQLREQFPEPAHGSIEQRCRATLARWPMVGNPVDADDLDRRFARAAETNACAAIVVLRVGNAGERRQLADARRAARLAPELLLPWALQAGLLRRQRRYADADSLLLEARRRVVPHARYRFEIDKERVQTALVSGDTARALRLTRALDRAFEADPRPLSRWRHLEMRQNDARARNDSANYWSAFPRLVAIARTSRAPAFEITALLAWAGAAADATNDNARVIALSSRAIAVADSARLPELESAARYRRGRAYAKRGDYAKGELDLLAALRLNGGFPSAHLANIHHDLAHVYEGASRWQEAVRQAELYERHSRFAASTSALYMMSLRDGGLIRWKAGQHAAAVRSMGRMVAEIERRRENFFYAGEFYERIGDYQQAAHYYRQGRATMDLSERADNLAGLARMYGALGFLDSARMAAMEHDAPGTRRGRARLLPAMLVRDGRADDAIRIARDDVIDQEKRGAAVGSLHARLGLAQLLVDAGRSGEALAQAVIAERRAVAMTLPDDRATALLIQARALESRHADSALKVVSSARSLVGEADDPARRLTIEMAGADILAKLGRTRDAAAAYAKAAAAADQITESFESAVDRARSHERRIAPFDGMIRLLVAAPRINADSLFVWSTRRKRVTSGVVGQSQLPVALSDWRRRLDSRTALVDYVISDGRVLAIVTTKTSVIVIRFAASEFEVDSLVKRLRRPFVTAAGGFLDLSRARFDLSLAHRLYVAAFAPVDSALRGLDRVMIVADGPLHAVPFAALVDRPLGDGQYLGARYLLDRYEMHLLPPGGVPSLFASNRTPAARRVTFVGGEVAGAEREGAAIARSFPQVRSLSADAATETSFRREAATAEILHVAAHARADEADPLASYLQIFPDTADDGLLHLSELGSLSGVRLVVLTGCETARGRAFAGSGPMGLAQGFMAAGARQVIATHWLIGETAADFTGPLYQHLKKGDDPGRALRMAQLALRQDARFANPLYWGAFLLISGG